MRGVPGLPSRRSGRWCCMHPNSRRSLLGPGARPPDGRAAFGALPRRPSSALRAARVPPRALRFARRAQLGLKFYILDIMLNFTSKKINNLSCFRAAFGVPGSFWHHECWFFDLIRRRQPADQAPRAAPLRLGLGGEPRAPLGRRLGATAGRPAGARTAEHPFMASS